MSTRCACTKLIANTWEGKSIANQIIFNNPSKYIHCLYKLERAAKKFEHYLIVLKILNVCSYQFYNFYICCSTEQRSKYTGRTDSQNSICGRKVKVLVALLGPSLCNPMNYCPPNFSVHGILQARTLEWASIPFLRGSSQPRDETYVSCIAGKFINIWATREANKGERDTKV